MKISITRKDISSGYLAQIIQNGSSLIILPLILNKLSQNELGIWYIFMAITGFVNLLDFGFSPILMRNISYVFSGAKKLIKNGINTEQGFGEIDYLLLYKLIKTGKTLYGIIAFSAFVLMGSIGTIYILSLIKELDHNLRKTILYSWYIFTFGVVFNLFYAYYVPLLQGRGFISKANNVNIISKFIYIFFSYVLILFGYGLIGLAISYLLSSFINRFLSIKYFFTNDLKFEFQKINKRKVNIQSTLRILWFNSSKLGLNAIGGFLILRANTFLCSSFLGLEDTARYGLTIQIFTVLSSFSLIFFNTYIPAFNSLRILNDTINIKKKFSLANFIAISVYCVGFAFIMFFGNYILKIIGSDTFLLNKFMLFILGLQFLLNMSHGLAATFLTTKNEVPFVKSTIISGLAVIFSSYFLIKYSGLQLWAIILPPFIIGLLYNNWKWPYVVTLDLKTNYKNLLCTGLEEFSLQIRHIYNATIRNKR